MVLAPGTFALNKCLSLGDLVVALVGEVLEHVERRLLRLEIALQGVHGCSK